MEDTKIGKLFKFLSFNFEKNLNKRLKEKDLSGTQGLVLIWLVDEESKELPIKTIEKKFQTAQSTTLGVINRLEKKELVSTYLTSQRTKIVKITDKGLDLVSCMITYIAEVDEIIFNGFTNGEKIIFIELLKKAENNLLQQHDIEMEDSYE